MACLDNVVITDRTKPEVLGRKRGAESSNWPAEKLKWNITVSVTNFIFPPGDKTHIAWCGLLSSQLSFCAVPEGGTVDSEMKVPSTEDSIKDSLPKALSRSDYSFARFADCQGFFLSNFCLRGPFDFIFPNSLEALYDRCHSVLLVSASVAHSTLFFQNPLEILCDRCLSVYLISAFMVHSTSFFPNPLETLWDRCHGSDSDSYRWYDELL